MSSPIASQYSLGIGSWTSVAAHDLGMIYKEPASPDAGERTYMYVQYLVSGNVAGYQGTPVGWSTNAGLNTYIVTGDNSASVAKECIGIVMNSTTAAVTTTHYGWIQLAKRGQILVSCAIVTGNATAANWAYWAQDSGFATTGSNYYEDNINTVIIALAAKPFGVIMSPTTATAVTGLLNSVAYQQGHIFVC